MNESYTAVIARNSEWRGAWATEPYECAWAREAVFFVRVLRRSDEAKPLTARVQISPDGMNWCDEGTGFEVPACEGVTFARVKHFGGWLRLAGDSASGGLRVMAYLCIKG